MPATKHFSGIMVADTELRVRENHMIPVYRPFFGGNEKHYVNQCLDTTWISSRGEFIEKFENAFKTYTGVNHALSVSNGTVAIHLALVALGIGPGDEVIVPSLTYVATVNCVFLAGATPVYVDSCEGTWQMDPAQVEEKITSRTRAVMAVHLYGSPCDMDALSSICARHDLLLIEDCAEAFGTYFKGRHVGTFGDAGTFSFFGNKTITTGEGGMVVVKDERLAERVFHLKNQGVSSTKEYWHDVIAFNYRMTNICAAIGLAQIERADEILARKRVIANTYRTALKGLPMEFHHEVADTVHSYWMCSVAVDDEQHRQPLRNHLLGFGIETRPIFYPAHMLPHLSQTVSLPVAEDISRRGINLPSFPDISAGELDHICSAITDYFAV